MNDCVFCKILNKEIPASVVYEDENVLVFLDAAPVNIGHSLIISKKHYVNIHDTPEELLSEMIKVVKKIANAVKKGTEADGINIDMNNGKTSGQVIFHTHIHVIPRFEGDGFEHWHGRRPYNEGEKEEVAKKISAALN